MMMLSSAPFGDDKKAPYAKHTEVGAERADHGHQQKSDDQLLAYRKKLVRPRHHDTAGLLGDLSKRRVYWNIAFADDQCAQAVRQQIDGRERKRICITETKDMAIGNLPFLQEIKSIVQAFGGITGPRI